MCALLSPPSNYLSPLSKMDDGTTTTKRMMAPLSTSEGTFRILSSTTVTTTATATIAAQNASTAATLECENNNNSINNNNNNKNNEITFFSASSSVTKRSNSPFSPQEEESIIDNGDAMKRNKVNFLLRPFMCLLRFKHTNRMSSTSTAMTTGKHRKKPTMFQRNTPPSPDLTSLIKYDDIGHSSSEPYIFALASSVSYDADYNTGTGIRPSWDARSALFPYRTCAGGNYETHQAATKDFDYDNAAAATTTPTTLVNESSTRSKIIGSTISLQSDSSSGQRIKDATMQLLCGCGSSSSSKRTKYRYGLNKNIDMDGVVTSDNGSGSILRIDPNNIGEDDDDNDHDDMRSNTFSVSTDRESSASSFVRPVNIHVTTIFPTHAAHFGEENSGMSPSSPILSPSSTLSKDQPGHHYKNRPSSIPSWLLSRKPDDDADCVDDEDEDERAPLGSIAVPNPDKMPLQSEVVGQGQGYMKNVNLEEDDSEFDKDMEYLTLDESSEYWKPDDDWTPRVLDIIQTSTSSSVSLQDFLNELATTASSQQGGGGDDEVERVTTTEATRDVMITDPVSASQRSLSLSQISVSDNASVNSAFLSVSYDDEYPQLVLRPDSYPYLETGTGTGTSSPSFENDFFNTLARMHDNFYNDPPPKKVTKDIAMSRKNPPHPRTIVIGNKLGVEFGHPSSTPALHGDEENEKKPSPSSSSSLDCSSTMNMSRKIPERTRMHDEKIKIHRRKKSSKNTISRENSADSGIFGWLNEEIDRVLDQVEKEGEGSYQGSRLYKRNKAPSRNRVVLAQSSSEWEERDDADWSYSKDEGSLSDVSNVLHQKRHQNHQQDLPPFFEPILKPICRMVIAAKLPPSPPPLPPKHRKKKTIPSPATNVQQPSQHKLEEEGQRSHISQPRRHHRRPHSHKTDETRIDPRSNHKKKSRYVARSIPTRSSPYRRMRDGNYSPHEN